MLIIILISFCILFIVQSKEEKYFINNHLSFRVMYHKDIETDSARIVGFEVTPNRYTISLDTRPLVLLAHFSNAGWSYCAIISCMLNYGIILAHLTCLRDWFVVDVIMLIMPAQLPSLRNKSPISFVFRTSHVIGYPWWKS